jgi:hypothetical protein
MDEGASESDLPASASSFQCFLAIAKPNSSDYLRNINTLSKIMADSFVRSRVIKEVAS